MSPITSSPQRVRLVYLTILFLNSIIFYPQQVMSQTVRDVSAKLVFEEDTRLDCMKKATLHTGKDADRQANKGRKLISSEKTAIELIDAFNERNGTEYAYLKHDSRSEKKGKKYIKTITVWDRGMPCTIHEVKGLISTAKTVSKKFADHDLNKASEILRKIIQRALTEDLPTIAEGLSGLPALEKEAYDKYFEEIGNFADILTALEVTGINERTLFSASTFAAPKITTEDHLIDYFTKFPKPYHYKTALTTAKNNGLSCERLKALTEGGAFKEVKLLVKREIQILCMESADDFFVYIVENHDSPAEQLSSVARRTGRYLRLSGCQIFDLFTRSEIIAEYKDEFFRDATLCIKTIDDCVTINKVYSESEEVLKVLDIAFTKFAVSEIDRLLDYPVYQKHKDYFQDRFLTRVTSLADLKDFFRRFPGNLDNSQAILRGIELAEVENDINALTEYVRRYISINPSNVESIRYHLNLDFMLQIAADASGVVKESLQEAILREIGGESIENIEKYRGIYPKNEEALLQEIGPYMNAEIAMYLFERVGDPGGIIERTFITKMSSVEHANWFLKKAFPNGEPAYQLGVLQRAALIAKNQEDRFAFLDQYLTTAEANFDKLTIAQCLPSADDQIRFIENYGRHRNKVCDNFFATTLTVSMIEKICAYCDKSIEDLNVGKLLYNDIRKTLNVKEQSVKLTSKASNFDPIVLPINQLGQLAVVAENLRSGNEAVLELFVDGVYKEEIRLTKDQPVTFLAVRNSLFSLGKELKIVPTYTDQIPLFEVVAINFPAQIGVGYLEDHFDREDSRSKLVESLDQLLDFDERIDYQKQLLGGQYLRAMRNSYNDDDVNRLVADLAVKYIKVYEAYPLSIPIFINRNVNYYLNKLAAIAGR